MSDQRKDRQNPLKDYGEIEIINNTQDSSFTAIVTDESSEGIGLKCLTKPYPAKGDTLIFNSNKQTPVLWTKERDDHVHFGVKM